MLDKFRVIFKIILKKCHLGSVYYPLVRKFIINKTISISDFNIQKLIELSPERKSSSIVNQMRSNKKEMDLDIIIPVYNVEPFLDECLQSVFNQKTKYQFRVILINDGSTDNSLKICNSYKNRANVVFINQTNEGLSSARNKGLDIMNSKYIMFLDSDDYLSQNAVEDLLDEAFKKDADIVQGNYTSFCNKNFEKIDLNTGNFDDVPGLVWAKVFKADLLQEIQFPLGYWYEDVITKMVIIPLSFNNVAISNNVYFHRLNKNGICASSKKNKKSVDTILIMGQLLEDAKQLNIIFDEKFYDFFLFQSALSFYRIKRLDMTIRKDSFKYLCILKNKYFSSFETNNNKYKEIEYALTKANYLLFENYVLLK